MEIIYRHEWVDDTTSARLKCEICGVIITREAVVQNPKILHEITWSQCGGPNGEYSRALQDRVNMERIQRDTRSAVERAIEELS